MTMREKMARAMFRYVDDRGFVWDNAPIWLCKRYLAMADAALAAMEEPTEAMERAGFCHSDSAQSVWRAMIGAAKGEG